MRSLEDIQKDIDLKESYLSELKAKKASGENLNYRNLERKLLPYDRDLAMKYGEMAEKQEKRAQEKSLKEQELALKEYKALNDGLTPDQVRTKLQSIYNTFQQGANNSDLLKDQRDANQKSANIVAAELQKEFPSIRNIWTEINKSNVGGLSTSADIQTSASPTVKEDYDYFNTIINDTLKDIKYQSSDLNAAVIDLKSKVRTASGKTILADEATRLLATIDDISSKKPKEPASKESIQKKSAERYVEDYAKTVEPKKLYAGITSVRNEINSLKDQLKGGVETAALTINMAPLKKAMGQLSSGEYGIAGGQFAAAMGSVPIVGDAITSISAQAKFNNKTEAIKAMNAMIKSANDIIKSQASIEKFVNDSQSGEFTKDQLTNAFKNNGQYSALFGIKQIPLITETGEDIVKPTKIIDKNAPKENSIKVIGGMRFIYNDGSWKPMK